MKYQYEIKDLSPADLSFLNTLISGYTKEVKLQKEWQSKFSEVLTVYEEPFNPDLYHLNVIVSTNDSDIFEYIIYEYSNRQMMIEDLEDLLSINMTEEQEGYEN